VLDAPELIFTVLNATTSNSAWSDWMMANNKLEWNLDII
jgi:hypothetical protein